MITGVIPTYRRRAALLVALPNHRRLDGVTELVVVDDGSDDGTADAVEALGLAGVRVLRHGVNRGLPAARNTGALAAAHEWVLFLEDDCGFPQDYAQVLLRTALETDADIVGAPWVATSDNVVARAAHASPVSELRLLSPPWAHPVRPLETPFMPALALVRRSVFDELLYDESYRGNFYREETDFYVRARRAGLRVVLTPDTAAWQIDRYGGGCKTSRRVVGDTWAARNTWVFLRRHGAWLRQEGLLQESDVRVEIAFLWPLLRHYLLLPKRAVGRLRRWARA